MSGFEIFLIVAISLTPIIALVIIFLGKKKKTATTESKAAEKPVEQPKKVEVKQEEPKQEKTIQNIFSNETVDEDSFKNYLNEKNSNNVKPNKIGKTEMKTYPYIPIDEPLQKETHHKKVDQQIKELSPELTALIITGILDRKDY